MKSSRDYKITSFTMKSGERFCHVVGREDGLPEFFSNLYLTTQVRNKGDSYSTLEAAASNLIVFLRFLSRRRIDIHERVLTRVFLAQYELDDLCDFTQRRFSTNRKVADDGIFNMEELEEFEEPVNSGTQYSRLTTVAYFLQWLSRYLLTDPGPSDSEKVDALVEQIKARRPTKKGRNSNFVDRALTNDQIEALFESIQIQHSNNPFGRTVQRRNRLVVLLLYYLGIRCGELLGIKVTDIDFAANQLHIVRRADEKSDPRIDEPNSKTEPRILPLSDALSKEIHDYVVNERRSATHRRRHEFLLVTHKEGPTIGQPMTKAGYNKVLSTLVSSNPRLAGVTGHMLRHTWNHNFSEKLDSLEDPPSSVKQEQMRSYLMGWKQGSGTAATYNRRFTARKGREAALSLQKSIGVRVPRELDNE